MNDQSVRGRSKWLGALVSPLPMVFFWLLSAALTVGFAGIVVTIAFVVLAYVTALVPLGLSLGLLRLASWQSLRAHLGVIFIVTFLPMLSVYHFTEFEPDAHVSYEINNAGPQVVEFAIAGVLIALIVALINVACMWIFWRLAVRGQAAADPMVS